MIDHLFEAVLVWMHRASVAERRCVKLEHANRRLMLRNRILEQG